MGLILNMEQALRCSYDRLMDAVGERKGQSECLQHSLYASREIRPRASVSGEEIADTYRDYDRNTHENTLHTQTSKDHQLKPTGNTYS